MENVVVILSQNAAHRNIQIRRVPGRAHAFIDPGVVEHILSNLVSNAITHSKGRKVLIGTRRAGANVEIIIADDGDGFSEQTLILSSSTHLHEIDKGRVDRSGLGMEIMFRLAEHVGISLKISSVPGRGVMASLTCPISPRSD